MADNWQFRKAIRKDAEFRKKMEKRREMREALYYAGVGSRKTPSDILDLMTQLASVLREDGFTLRSGHAQGADQAFQYGAKSSAEIYLPWRGFNRDDEFAMDYELDKTDVLVRKPLVFTEPTGAAYRIASEVHPAWGDLSRGATHLHARNAHQILGRDLNSLVQFVICWTPGGRVTGGTATAINLAVERYIPVWNLADEDTYDMAFEFAWKT